MTRPRIRQRPRQRGQAVVEFGILALLFTTLLFAIVDYGLLLNTWLAVSSASRDLAREAAVGQTQATLTTHATSLSLPGVNRNDPNFAGGYCCGATSALVMEVRFFPCPPDATCAETATPHHGDTVVVTLRARGAQVVTPLVRPFFGCGGGQPTCYTPVNSTTKMRYEGPTH